MLNNRKQAMFEFKKYKAFSISSLFIMLLLLAIIIIPITSPAGSINKNKDKIMFKKAYYTTEKTVLELISDTILYPKNPELAGFRNNSSVTTQSGITIDEKDNADTKFYKLFKNSLNGQEIGKSTFKTQDGMVWKIPSEGSIENEAKITIQPFPEKKPEITFDIFITYDGKINLKNDKELKYLSGDKP